MGEAERSAEPSSAVVPLAVTEAVERLPEQCQPIWGYQQFDASAQRPSVDRLEIIRDFVADIAEDLGRPARVLDVGCAQGYFSLGLAEAGAVVTGLDHCAENIDLCRLLASGHDINGCNFLLEDLESHLASAVEYDVVIALSVLHHVAHARGQRFALDLLGSVAERARFLVLEFATPDEPLYWAQSQPEVGVWFEGFSFARSLHRERTHLGSDRTTSIASRTHWHFPGDVRPLTGSWTSSNLLAPNVHQGSRRFLAAEGAFAKIESGGPSAELIREVEFLREPVGIPTPELFQVGSAAGESWIVRAQMPGVPLEAIDLAGVPMERRRRWLASAVDALAALEAHGRYHTDVRVWNLFLQDDDTVRLIDFGAITHTPEDVVWPRDLRLSTLLLVDEILIGPAAEVSPIRRTVPPAITDWPSDVAGAVLRWILRDDPHPRFAELAQALSSAGDCPSGERIDWPEPVRGLLDEMFSAVELNQNLHHEVGRRVAEASRLNAALAGISGERDRLRSEFDGVVAERDALRVERDAVAVERDAVVADRDALRVDRDGVVADRDRWAEQFRRLRARRSVRVALWFARIVGRVRRLLPGGR